MQINTSEAFVSCGSEKIHFQELKQKWIIKVTRQHIRVQVIGLKNFSFYSNILKH